MRYAIKTSPQETTVERMRDVWQAADEHAIFESAWTFDHFYPIFSDSDGPCMEGWVTLTALAAVTSRIRVGCLVTGILYRHPAVLANMAATLDIVSNGRLELGLGAGWNEEEFRAFGLPYDHRESRFEEAFEIIRGLLAGERVTLHGRFH